MSKLRPTVLRTRGVIRNVRACLHMADSMAALANLPELTPSAHDDAVCRLQAHAYLQQAYTTLRDLLDSMNDANDAPSWIHDAAHQATKAADDE